MVQLPARRLRRRRTRARTRSADEHKSDVQANVVRDGKHNSDGNIYRPAHTLQEQNTPAGL